MERFENRIRALRSKTKRPNNNKRKKREAIYNRKFVCLYLEIGAGKPCAAHASARDSPSTPRYLLRPSPVPFGPVRPDGSGNRYSVHRPDRVNNDSLVDRKNKRLRFVLFSTFSLDSSPSHR